MPIEHLTPQICTAKRSEWPTDPDKYIWMNLIGCGSTSKVYLSYCITTKSNCAIKRIDYYDYEPENIKHMMNEIHHHSNLNHPNIIKYYTSFLYSSELWIVMEYCNAGTLRDVINKTRSMGDNGEGVLSKELIAIILRKAMLEKFDNQCDFQQDIKSINILLTTDGCVKVADFGVSIGMKTENGRILKITDFSGTPCWMAPEIMEGEPYDEKVDIWSLGIMALELVTGEVPYSQYNPSKIILMITDNPPPGLKMYDNKNYYKNYRGSFNFMLQRCLTKNVNFRATSNQLINDPFFNNVKKINRLVKHLRKINAQDIHQVINMINPSKSMKMSIAYRNLVFSMERYKDPSNVVKLTLSQQQFCHQKSCYRSFEKFYPHNHAILRMKSKDKHLHDIGFVINKDEPVESIIADMIQEELIFKMNGHTIVQQIEKMMSNDFVEGNLKFALEIKHVDFPKYTGTKNFIGYGRLMYNKIKNIDHLLQHVD
ncbi:hypothetical protein A3Q56_04291 [Intoshia linei]|uniref:non-specific serine/threonine protein kinase n=1 Tax=Intoshia linei TaxID=1819745 RepID=A0A177B114_9BILA|nr:hypothetical protein A3Q56_04291 [Intoshia linei]